MKNHQILRIWWPSFSVPASDVWQALFDNRALLQLPDHFQSSESETNDESDQWSELFRTAKSSGRWPAFIRYGQTTVWVSCTGVYLKSVGIVENSVLLDQWVRACKKLSFIQAWVADTEFAYWQSTSSITLHKNMGRYQVNAPHRRATAWVEPFEIDTSRNPGREIRCGNYWQAVGSQMWLSDGFWIVLGKTLADFRLDARFGHVERFDSDAIKISAALEPFSDESKREVMDALRQAVFGVAPPTPWPIPLPLEARGPEWFQRKTGWFSRLFKS